MNDWVLLGPVIGIVGLIFFLLLLKPLSALFRWLLRLAGSVLSLVLINLLGASFGLTVGINLVTVLTAAVLGLPGVTARAVSRLILNL